jgi:tetrapyrrole methylase family protein/MazG family protein
MTITILGLGPGNPAHLTLEAWDLLAQADQVYLRTAHHPAVAALPAHLTLHSFDHLYDTLDDFDTVYETMVEQIVALGHRPQGVLYAVPGHPLVGESSVQRILARAHAKNLVVHLVEGLSFIEPVLGLLGIDGLTGLQLADALDLAATHHPHLDPDRPALIGQLYGQRVASEVKLALMNAYPDDHLVTLAYAAGTKEEDTATIPLYELDRGQRLDHLTALYVPPLPAVSSLAAFQATIARLRAPDGCPWDREQTHQSLRANLLEEAYEVLTALDAEDIEKLRIAMHVQIATEEGTFQFADVISHIDAKLKRRHPHVFGDLEVNDTATVLRNWEAIKANERAVDGHADRSRLEGIPVTLPALARAQSLGDRSARDGFDWPDLEGVLAKVGEEVSELCSAADLETKTQELGDLLFTLANVARWLGVDAESALRGTCDRFTHRYATMERMARAQGISLADMPAADRETLWDSAKESEPPGSNT